MGYSAERPIVSGYGWNEWRDILEWVLLSEGGHNIAPHTDSYGLATRITVQEGHVSFRWLLCLTQTERGEWMADPYHFTGGQWRYVVFAPSQTVFL